MPKEWIDGDSLWVALPSGEEVMFAAMPDRGENLFSWGSEGKPVRLAYLDPVDSRTVRVRLVEGVP